MPPRSLVSVLFSISNTTLKLNQSSSTIVGAEQHELQRSSTKISGRAPREADKIVQRFPLAGGGYLMSGRSVGR